MKHSASPKFWSHYKALPKETQLLADKCYELLRQNPSHPSLNLKKVRIGWSVRVGLHYRALAIEDDGQLAWFWIGSHAEYDRLMG